MNRYLALLRGINVSGQRKVPMSDLRHLLSNAGLQHVETYIQSGNVIFQSEILEQSKLQLVIEEAIRNQFGFEVPVLVKTPTELKQVFDDCPFPKHKKEESYFMMLFSKPEPELVKEVSKLSYSGEEFYVENNCVYFYSSVVYGNAKFNNNFFEKKLNVTATARNYKTMVKLLSLSAEKS